MCVTFLSHGLLACQGSGPPVEKPLAGAGAPADLPVGHPAIPTDTGAEQVALMTGPARVALDSANALFKAKRYQHALEKYRLAARLAPDEKAPLIGILMVATAVNDKRLADSVEAVLRR